MTLDLSPFERAITRLDEGWQRYQQDIRDVQIRDGLIQRFEFTYEICIKTIRRYFLQTLSSTEVVRTMTFDQLIRHAYSLGLLNEEIVQWRLFREKRNITSHTYDESKALEVCAIIPAFLHEAQYLHAALKKQQASDRSS